MPCRPFKIDEGNFDITSWTQLTGANANTEISLPGQDTKIKVLGNLDFRLWKNGSQLDNFIYKNSDNHNAKYYNFGPNKQYLLVLQSILLISGNNPGHFVYRYDLETGDRVELGHVDIGVDLTEPKIQISSDTQSSFLLYFHKIESSNPEQIGNVIIFRSDNVEELVRDNDLGLDRDTANIRGKLTSTHAEIHHSGLASPTRKQLPLGKLKINVSPNSPSQTFNDVKLGIGDQTSSVIYRITNEQQPVDVHLNGCVHVTAIDDNIPFFVDPPQTSAIELDPGEHKDLTIKFAPTIGGNYMRILTVHREPPFSGDESLTCEATAIKKRSFWDFIKIFTNIFSRKSSSINN